jgi:hypothetical protein
MLSHYTKLIFTLPGTALIISYSLLRYSLSVQRFLNCSAFQRVEKILDFNHGQSAKTSGQDTRTATPNPVLVPQNPLWQPPFFSESITLYSQKAPKAA